MNVAPVSDEIIYLQKLVSGDETAFKKIYEQYYQTVRSFAFHLTKSNEQAEEITQVVFVAVWEKREQVIPGTHFKAYIKKITLNHVINFLKKANRDKQLQQEIFNNMQEIQADSSEAIIEKELQQVYNDAVCGLPRQKKIIYQLSRNDDFTYTEIAKKLNLSKSTVKNHMIEALKIIRRNVSKQILFACLFFYTTHL